MSYPLLKNIHIFCAALSFALFFLRGIWRLNASATMQQRWLRIVPHVVDTALLCSAIGLAMTLRQYPLADAWLSAKVAALLLYIVLGSVALKYAKTKNIRLSAWLAAQVVFAYIVLTALSRDPFWMMP